jgi:hypothetical protein
MAKKVKRLCRNAESGCVEIPSAHLYDHSKFKTCPECEWLSRDIWRRRNRAGILDYQRRWRKKNQDKVRQYARKWREKWGPLAWLDDRPVGK